MTEEVVTVLKIKIFPRASQDQISGFMEDGTIKMRLTAPPVDGKANHQLIKFLSEILEVPTSKIEIVTGKTNHTKLVKIIGVKTEVVKIKINKRIKSSSI